MIAPTDDLAARRLAALDAPHLRRLEAWRASLDGLAMPHFDPFDGGEQAACLLLLETPGPRGDAVRFVSRDNSTATARNITRFCEAAGLARRDMVVWNAVPWLIHAQGARNRAPRRSEIVDGLALLPGLLALLPHLRVAVLAGRAAAGAAPILHARRPEVAVLTMPHPSPIYVNTASHIAPGIIATLREAADRIAGHGSGLDAGSAKPASSHATPQRGLVGSTPGGSGVSSGRSS